MIRNVIIWSGRVVVVSTMLLAGAHVAYYLYYWQWVRAQIAGVLFVAALVIAATWLILARLKHIERDVARRLEMARVAAPTPTIDAYAAGSAPDSFDATQPDFPWLAADFSPPRHQALAILVLAAAGPPIAEYPRTAIFIPALLGAGLVVSLVAGLAERTATATYARTTPAQAVRKLIIGGVVAVVAAGLVIAALWWTAHYRPVVLGEGQTEITVQVSSHARPRPAVETVEIIGRYCARDAIPGVRFQRVQPVSPDSAMLIVSPLLDEDAQRRYGGCLKDAILERYRLTVTKTELVPARDEP